MAKSFRKDPRLVTRTDHEAIQARIGLSDTEDYVVTIQKGKGFWQKTVHVFSRKPTLKEINDYEQTASRVKFRGQKAELEGSQINAATTLYNKLIARVYDALIGVKTVDQLDRQGAVDRLDPMVKREAVREFIGEVYSATRMAESVGGEDDEDDKEEDATLSAVSPESED